MSCLWICEECGTGVDSDHWPDGEDFDPDTYKCDECPRYLPDTSDLAKLTIPECVETIDALRRIVTEQSVILSKSNSSVEVNTSYYKSRAENAERELFRLQRKLDQAIKVLKF